MKIIKCLDRAFINSYAVDEDTEQIIYANVISNKEAALKSITASINLGDRGYVSNTENMELQDEELRKYTEFIFKGGKGEYKVPYERLELGKQNYYSAAVIHKDILMDNGRYFISWEEPETTLFHKLMNMFNFPLLEEWSHYFFTRLTELGYLSELKLWVDRDADINISLANRELRLADMKVFRLILDEKTFEEIISEGLAGGHIRISPNDQKPLQFANLDEYFQNYGHSAVENLIKDIDPLLDHIGSVNVINKKKKIFPKQAAMVNGISELLRYSNVGMFICSMGTGKSLMSSICVEKNGQDNVRRIAGDLSLGDLTKKAAYRAILMCPSILLKKWEREILEEIPLAKVVILDDLKKVAELCRQADKKPEGKCFYIISKDYAKLNYQSKPAVNRYTRKKVYYVECTSCRDTSTTLHEFKTNGSICPVCEETDHEGNGTLRVHYAGYSVNGWTCPECGEILFPANKKKLKLDIGEEDSRTAPLHWSDFSGQTEANTSCYNCGSSLWTPTSDTISYGQLIFPSKQYENWVRLSYWRNQSKKTKKTVWVHKKFVEQYIQTFEIKEGEWSIVKQQTSRKVAPSYYLKKMLPQKFFDYFIADEVHQLKGGGSAQGNTFHSLIKLSQKQIVLTGTLLGGVASDMFYLLYRLVPWQMKEKGYEYGDVLKFAEDYGVVETEYQYDSKDEFFNTSSRGKRLNEPRVRPGISPLLYAHFLFDKAVFLDLSDLSAYLPKFIEKPIRVGMSDEMSSAYFKAKEFFKRMMFEKGGRKLLPQMLQTLLAYPDKPFGLDPICHPTSGRPLFAFDELDPNELYPKEKELVDLINQEYHEEGRPCFVYTVFTGEGKDKDTTPRLLEIIEKHCDLRGKVEILRANTVKPEDRERWIEEAWERGVKVVITNPKLVEVGLDLLNYPTLIFYQTGYSLFTVWQASRRSFRLNQKKECRVFYFAYKNTMQDECLKIMADKKVSTAAVQGKFSSEGLAAMSSGVNPQVALAQALAEGNMISDNAMDEMFNKINEANSFIELTEEDKILLASLEEDPIVEVLVENIHKEPVNMFDWFNSMVNSTITSVTKATSKRAIEESTPDLFIIKAENIKGKRKNQIVEGQLSLFGF